MTQSIRTWDVRVDAALALFIAAAVVGMLGFTGLIGSTAGAPGGAAYALLALSLAAFTWAGIRAAVRTRAAHKMAHEMGPE